MVVSPLAPACFPELPLIRGVRLTTARCGMKYQGRDDLMAMLLDPGSHVAGVFTESDTAAAAPRWNRQHCRNATARAIITNAGNANAFTGEQGMQDVIALCAGFAAHIGAQSEDVLIASTGVIGESLDCALITAEFQKLATADDAGWQAAAKAIRTTDTFAKGAGMACRIDGAAVQICGIAKGSGMIAPNMATMLGSIATDAAIAPDALQALLISATNRSFNAITVDSDTSTSDSVFLIATGAAANAKIEDPDDPRLAEFRHALDHVMQDLATQIVRDGEGASKFITIDITGARDEISAHKIGMSVANSPLVKTAIAGGDANWGRIVMAVGKAGQSIDQSCLAIAMGGITIARDGARVEGFDETPVTEHMAGDNISIQVCVGDGPGTARVWTCDLTHGYVSINADYRS